jgi:hypothetical protein
MARCEPESVQVERNIVLLRFAEKEREQLSNCKSRHQLAEPKICGTEQLSNCKSIHQLAEPKICGTEHQSDPEYVHEKVMFFQKIAHVNSFWHFTVI